VEAGTRAVIYRRVSTQDQGSSGLGLEAQDAACRSYCDLRGWVVTAVHEDVCSGSAKRRPGLDAALASLEPGDVFIAAKMDRFARSFRQAVRLMERAEDEGWALVAADGSVDLTTPHGRAMARVAAAFAALEAELTGVRTREALTAAKARGVQLGRRPSTPPADVARRVRRWRREGWTLQRMADRLNTLGVPSPNGGRWYAETASRVVRKIEEG
jgi:DNA invertase Pin-like site-specific DNA recombinase